MRTISRTMEYKLWQYPRGANKGGVLNVDVSPTISTSSWENNCLLIEIYEQENICDSPPPKDEGQDSGGAEIAPTLLASDYKSPHLVIEYAERKEKGPTDNH